MNTATELPENLKCLADDFRITETETEWLFLCKRHRCGKRWRLEKSAVPQVSVLNLLNHAKKHPPRRAARRSR